MIVRNTKDAAYVRGVWRADGDGPGLGRTSVARTTRKPGLVRHHALLMPIALGIAKPQAVPRLTSYEAMPTQCVWYP